MQALGDRDPVQGLPSTSATTMCVTDGGTARMVLMRVMRYVGSQVSSIDHSGIFYYFFYFYQCYGAL